MYWYLLFQYGFYKILMSEYQYYEFCRIHGPLSQEARQILKSLSSRAKVMSHSATYVYNYGDFPGDPKKLLLNYFDIFFYIANWGTIQLMFKYPMQQIQKDHLKQYLIKDVIGYKQYQQGTLLTIEPCNEEGFGWIDGENLLSDLLPLYDEIQFGNYQFLELIAAIHAEWDKGKADALNLFLSQNELSEAQVAFLSAIGMDEEISVK